MITRLLTAGCLMALCVIIHAGGVAWALQRLRGYFEPSPKFWRETWLFVMVILHRDRQPRLCAAHESERLLMAEERPFVRSPQPALRVGRTSSTAPGR
jgi:hypothetical protein